MIATGGTWDPTNRRVVFLASNPFIAHDGGVPDTHDHYLVAVNDISSAGDLEACDQLIDKGAKLLVDSGIFWLTNRHKRAHNITMDEALALAPADIEGFDELWTRYLQVIRHFGDRVWGYMELDQGGEANKRVTRQRLHDEGVHPIPVWHPLNDGADYFDELAETHDRICCGNIVQASNTTRVRLLHTMWEKHRQYPDLWVHVLGMNPSEWFHCLAIDSADASTWVAPVRWGRHPHSVMLDPYVEKQLYEHVYTYAENTHHQTDPDERLDKRALQCAALTIDHAQRGWRAWQARIDEEFGPQPLYPPLEAAS